MSVLNLYTVTIMAGLSCLSIVIGANSYQKNTHFTLSIKLWTAGQLALAVGGLLFLGREYSAFWFSSVPNAILSMGFGLQIAAYADFFQLIRLRRALFPITLIVIIWQLSLRGFGWDEHHRQSGMLITLLMQQGLFIYVLRQGRYPRNPLIRFLILANIIFLTAQLARFAETIFSSETYTFVNPGPALVLGVVVEALALQVNGFAFLFLIKDRSEELLSSLATTDPLTEIFNRRGFLDLAGRKIALAKRSKKPISILMCDIDHFKRINDNYGHDGGDKILKELTKIFRSVLRESDLLGRWGGEEFIILTPDTGIDGALELAKKLNSMVADLPIAYFESVISITISIGVTEWEYDEDFSQTIIRADQALYQSKIAGRNRVETMRSNNARVQMIK